MQHNVSTIDTLTPQQKAEIDRAVKRTVKRYRKTLLRLALT